MSADIKELRALADRIRKTVGERDAILKEIAVGEGVYAVKQARIIVKNEKGLFNTGKYRQSFHAGGGGDIMAVTDKTGYDGTPPVIDQSGVQIDVYNNLEYAQYLEHGYRQHFVPGKWEGRNFVYIPFYKPPKGKPAGMTVGPGPAHKTFERAMERTKTTQRFRIARKIKKYCEFILTGGKPDGGSE